ncbi:MAG TPA: hypothetical protein VEA35_02735 [Ramlibacter sp.]|nr:hypothetical protein [Candidatus Limnocylindrales bacterium]HYF41344.1 hypothetical protein [Ramlibacter sp.]
MTTDKAQPAPAVPSLREALEAAVEYMAANPPANGYGMLDRTTDRERLEVLEMARAALSASPPVVEPVEPIDQVQELMRLADEYNRITGSFMDEHGEFLRRRSALETAIRAALAPPAATAMCVQKVIAWVLVLQDGTVSGEIIFDHMIEEVRKKSGAWKPLVIASPAASTAAQDLGVSAPSSPPGSLSQAPTIPDAHFHGPIASSEYPCIARGGVCMRPHDCDEFGMCGIAAVRAKEKGNV